MAAQPSFLTRHRGWVIRLAGSALFLGVLFWLLPVATIGAALAALPPGVFAAVLGLFFLAHVVAAFKWWLLLARGLPFAAAVRAHYAGLAANLCLPGAIGGDAVRAGLAHQAMRDGARVVAVAAADRLIDLLALLTLAALGLAIASQGGAGAGTTLALAAGFFAALAGGLLALPQLLPLPWKLVPGLPGKRFAEKFADALAALRGRPGLLLAALALSLAVQAALIVMSWWLAHAVHTGASPGQWLFAWPLAKVAAVLPVSLNGLGLREAALAANLAAFGADAARVVTAGLIWQAVLFIGGGIGALALALSGGLRAAQPPAQNPDFTQEHTGG